MNIEATVENGHFVVNNVSVALATEAMLLLECDTLSKYPGILTYSGVDVTIVPRPESLALNLEAPDEHTTITLSLPEGWEIRDVQGERYTITILVVNTKAYTEFERSYLWQRAEGVN